MRPVLCGADMSAIAYRWAIDQKIQTAERSTSASSMKAVLLALAWYADESGGNAYPGVSRLSSHTGLSARSVRRALAGLRSCGLIIQDGWAPHYWSGDFDHTVGVSGDTVQRSHRYRLNIAGAATVTGDTVTGAGDTVTRAGDTVTGAKLTSQGDTVTGAGDTVTGTGDTVTGAGDMVTPKEELQTNNRTQLFVNGGLLDGAGVDVSGVVSEAFDQWHTVSKRPGLVCNSTDRHAIERIIVDYSFQECMDAIAAIGAGCHPRPMVFWIRDRIKQRREQQKNRTAKQQRGRAGVGIETAWSERASRVKPSIRERLKAKGNP